METNVGEGAQPREPRYGWVMVVLAALFMGVGSGSLGAVAVFLKPLTEEFGWLRGETSLAYLAGAAAIGLSGIIAGWLADRHSARPVVLFGAVALAAGYLLLSRVSSLWQLYGFYIVLTGLGAAAFDAPLLANLGNWFGRNKGLAMGVATAGRSLGQGLVPFAAGALIAGVGWRDAYQWMGLAALAGLVPVVLLIRRSPAELSFRAGGEGAGGQGAAAYPLAPQRFVPWLGGAAIFCCICMATPTVQVVALAQDLGIATRSAASVLLVIYVFGFLGRIFFGRLSDHIGGLRAYLCASLSQTVLVFWFTRMDSLVGLLVIAALFGFGFSGVMTCVVVCVREFVPLHRRGISQGVVLFLAWLGMGLGGWQGGYFFDLTGSYTLSFANAALAGLVNLTILGALWLTVTRRQALLAAEAGTA
jgi:MFS family permease